MADETLTFLVGLALGAVVVAIIISQLRQSDGQQQHPAMTSHTVVRDDEGRIQSVDTISGLPMGHQGQQAQQPAVRQQPEAPRLGEMN